MTPINRAQVCASNGKSCSGHSHLSPGVSSIFQFALEIARLSFAWVSRSELRRGHRQLEGPSPESGHVVNPLATGRTPSPSLLPLITSSRDDQRRLRCAAAPLDVKWISFKRRRDSSSHRFRNNFAPWECASPERLSTLRRGSDTVCGQSRTCVPWLPGALLW